MKRKQIDYASLFTLRKDGRYQGYCRDKAGKRKAVYDRDPERLWHRINDKVEEKPFTFAEIAEAWQTEHREHISYKTAETYRAPLQRLLDRFGDLPATEVSAQRIHSFFKDLANKSYSRRSVQMHRDIINMIYNHAIMNGKVSSNPCSAVSIPRNLPVTKRQPPEDAAISAVMRSSAPFSLFAKVCLYAGLRRGEALALRYEDIDRTNNVIHVTKSVGFIGNQPHIQPPKSEAGVRDVILLDALADALPSKKSGYVFAREDGGLLTKDQFVKRWAAYCKAIGYKFSPHQLRHGFATILYEAHIPEKDAQELLGHSSIVLTMNVYTHIRERQKQATASRINQYVNTLDVKTDVRNPQSVENTQ